MVRNKNPQPLNKFRIHDLKKTKHYSPVDYDFDWDPVSAEGVNFLPVAVDEDDTSGRKDDGKQSRRRLLFASGPRRYYKHPLYTGLL